VLLARYAACANEAEIKKAEEVWLEKLEREYAARRDVDTADDAWKGGNLNHRPVVDSDEEDDKDKDSNESGSQEEDDRDPYALPEEEDDEEEMAELRRRVLQSKPFSNPQGGGHDEAPKPISRPANLPKEPEPDSDNDEDEDFDNIINATLVTDRTGIMAREKMKSPGDASATFSRTVVNAPSKW
jgi:pre-rRNA-processing protein TSR3